MKCRSIACIWSDSPPAHKVTATAVLDRPPTLYTGGSDGTIVWWNLVPTDSSSGIRPIAMLCGHAAPIADLDICFPATVAGEEKIGDSSNVAPNSNSVNYGALISACSDGVLCVWSRGSGHCRRRRKMPPWVGSPSMVRALPENRRYVCVACCFYDSIHVSDHQSLDSGHGDDALINKELQYGKPSKCTIVIIDSYSLTIVQTVFHGNLSIGHLRFMSVILPVGNMENQSVMMIDSSGKVEFVPLLKETYPNGENLIRLRKSSSSLEITDSVIGSNERGLVVAFATLGLVLALVYKTYCVFRLLDDGTTVGKISFLDSQLCIEDDGSQSHVIGGMFLERDDAKMKITFEVSENVFLETFAVWNNRGRAILYTISYSSNTFKFEPLSAIPAVLHPPDVRLSICFLQLNSYLLRIESVCFHMEEPMPWRPHVTMWLLPQQHDNNGNYFNECGMITKGNFFVSWVMSSISSHKTEGLRDAVGVKTTGQANDLPSQQSCTPLPKNADGTLVNDECHYQDKNLVSSSMVISENYYAPYAIVYGFYSGEIEVLLFDTFFEGLASHHGSPGHESDSHASKQYLSGHTGAVLCLAAHRMVSTSQDWNFNHVLVSGSMDCTIRIWDLDSSNIITVMHQHVAPVRQIILPASRTDRPWSDCFLSVGEDSCVALASLETLRVERMFPGHPYCPDKVFWDSTRGYVACLCMNHSGASDAHDVLYIWDIKTGARERVLRGTAVHSMFDHFCSSININSLSVSPLHANTSASSLQFPLTEDAQSSQPLLRNSGKGVTSSNLSPTTTKMAEPNSSRLHTSKSDAANCYPSTISTYQSATKAIKCSCPFPGIATLNFDLASLMSLCQIPEFFEAASDIHEKSHLEELGSHTPKSGYKRVNNNMMQKQGAEVQNTYHIAADGGSDLQGTSTDILENNDWDRSLEGCLLQFSLSFLHFWDVDCELDKLLITEMNLKRPDNFIIGSGLLGDKGSLTLTFPSPSAALELWRSSSEFCAIRSVTMVSLAQHMISLSHSCSTASSALAAFYTRNFAEKIPDIKPPLLQLLVSLWQDKSEHVRMAARSLFHCAATWSIPRPLCSEKAIDHAKLLGSRDGIVESGNKYSSTEEISTNSLKSDGQPTERVSEAEESEILAWLESFEGQEWISCVEGTSQDAMTSHIIVAAALAVWYPSLVKPNLSTLAVHPLMKLVMAMNEKYSSTAAEILAEGMENTWKACIGFEIPRLIGDIFFQIECVSGASASSSAHNPAPSLDIRETLVGILLPSLAMADIPGFLNAVERQIWSTASDSPVHVVSLMILSRIVRGSPRYLAQYLDKVINFVLQTMDPGNSVMRKICLQSSMAALKEVVRVYPMVALNDKSTRLAVGDAFGEINNPSIRVYEMQSMTVIKILDASGPPGLPSLLGGDSELSIATAISALSFSLDGEGLVAFSEHGLMIRWWSLGSVWWEKLSRNLVPVQCTKLIFVPPWEGFSPNSTRSSVMASVLGNERQANWQEYARSMNETDRLKLLIHNLDLSYRLEWVGERKILLSRHGQDLGTFQL